jgi:hypothetical protein
VAACVLLAALTFRSLQREAERRAGQARAEALFELVQDKTPSRPTDTPGVAAWLHVELKKYRRHIADPARARLYGQITDWHDDSTLPPFLAGIRDLLLGPAAAARAVTGPAAGAASPAAAPSAPGPAADAPGDAVSGADTRADAGSPEPPAADTRADAGSPEPPAAAPPPHLLTPTSPLHLPTPTSPPRLPTPASPPHLLTPAEMGDGAAAAAVFPLQFRTQEYLEMAGRWLVVTRRRALDSPDLGGGANPSNRFLLAASRRLLAAARRFDDALARRPLPATPGARPPRVVRLYAVSDDGTFVSLPFVPAGAGAAAARRAALDEGREFRKVPELPSFISNEFVFRFDFNAPQGQSYYSGLYLDLGGQGVVATVTAPVRETGPAGTIFQGILAADLLFGIDWRDFAAQIEPPLVAAAVHLGPPAERSWRPWTAIERELHAGGEARLRAAAARLAARESSEGHFVSPFYLVHGVVEGQGAVAALQVAANTWLVILFPESRAGFAPLPIVLLCSLFALLLAGFETARRRTARAQRKAQREWQEKQNLLNTMQVPLMVVDPNSDEVVFGNEAAAALGIESGGRAGDLVAPEPRARAHYDRMQVAGPGERRAYGVPVRVRGERGQVETRHAIVRSVAVAAPIEALRADERHRLAILFLLEPEADLALFSAELVETARGDERRRLAGLLAHGLDTLTRVLVHVLDRGPVDGDPRGFADWLAGYLERRVLAIAWLLEHWDATPPLPPDSSIEAAQARATVERFGQVFARVRGDALLRSRLHWDNGVLAAPPPDGDRVLRVAIDWPEEFWFACPLAGGFGFFLGEVLVNAIRHGRPGSLPELAIALDRVRKELVFTVTNQVRKDWPAPPAADGRTAAGGPDGTGGRSNPDTRDATGSRGDTGTDRDAGLRDEAGGYGGRRILVRLARLFEWRELAMERRGDDFVVSWRVAVSERGDPARAD